MIFAYTVLRPYSFRDFDGKIVISRVCAMKEAQRTTAGHQKGEKYAVDVQIDSEYNQEGTSMSCSPQSRRKF